MNFINFCNYGNITSKSKNITKKAKKTLKTTGKKGKNDKQYYTGKELITCYSVSRSEARLSRLCLGSMFIYRLYIIYFYYSTVLDRVTG